MQDLFYRKIRKAIFVNSPLLHCADSTALSTKRASSIGETRADRFGFSYSRVRRPDLGSRPDPAETPIDYSSAYHIPTFICSIGPADFCDPTAETHLQSGTKTETDKIITNVRANRYPGTTKRTERSVSGEDISGNPPGSCLVGRVADPVCQPGKICFDFELPISDRAAVSAA
jgi:hypothetical protein